MHPLQEAKDITDTILTMTKALELTGVEGQEEKEAEDYANLMERREPLVARLTALRGEINEDMTATPSFAAIKQTITDITDLDRKHLHYINFTVEAIHEAFKRIKQGQRIHQGYTDIQPDSVPRMIDVKQ